MDGIIDGVGVDVMQYETSIQFSIQMLQWA